MEFKIKDCYICDFCRKQCQGTCDTLKRIISNGGTSGNIEDDNDFKSDRKQIISCLGKYCDRKCKFNREDAYLENNPQIWFNTIKYLGNKVNELIEENNKLKEEINSYKHIENL